MFHSKQTNVWALIKEKLYCDGHNLQLRSSRNCVFRSRCPYYCHFLNLNFSLICQFALALKLNKLSYICTLGDYFRKYQYLRMYTSSRRSKNSKRCSFMANIPVKAKFKNETTSKAQEISFEWSQFRFLSIKLSIKLYLYLYSYILLLDLRTKCTIQLKEGDVFLRFTSTETDKRARIVNFPTRT